MIGSRGAPPKNALPKPDRSEIQSDEPWELLSYHRSKLRWRGSLRYSNMGLITTTIIGIGRPYNLHHFWSCNNSFSILFQKRKKKTRKGLAISQLMSLTGGSYIDDHDISKEKEYEKVQSFEMTCCYTGRLKLNIQLLPSK